MHRMSNMQLEQARQTASRMERTPPVTVVIACAPYHERLVQRAIDSVSSQSIITECLVVYDHERNGAGWARNEGLKQVRSPFTVFLDADDWIEQTFIEECLRAYDGRRYVFTDWITDRIIHAPECPWKGDGGAHIVTTLLPTTWLRYVGGFDEALPGGEDTDLFWKLTRSGLCGKRLPKPLFHYSKDGQRAAAFVHSAEYRTIMQGVVERYRGKPMACGGCGGETDVIDNTPNGEQFEGSVLATALWGGNQSQRGRISGRQYPRTGNMKTLWVDPRDIDAAPHLFARVVELPGKPQESDFQQWARGAMQHVTGKPSQPDIIPVQSAPVRAPVKADVQGVLKRYAQTR